MYILGGVHPRLFRQHFRVLPWRLCSTSGEGRRGGRVLWWRRGLQVIMMTKWPWWKLWEWDWRWRLCYNYDDQVTMMKIMSMMSLLGMQINVEDDELGQDLIFGNLPLLSYWCILYHQGGGQGSGIKKRSSFPATCGRWSCRVAEFHKINSNLVKFI